MLDSLTLLRAMNGIHEEDVVMAGNSYFGRRKNTYHRTKRIVTLALAAALVLALGAVAFAMDLLGIRAMLKCRFFVGSDCETNSLSQVTVYLRMWSVFWHPALQRIFTYFLYPSVS